MILNWFPWHGKDPNGDYKHNHPTDAAPKGPWFNYNWGGYATLSFIPTLATMILGLIAGGWPRRDEADSKKKCCMLLWLGPVEPGSKKVLRMIIAGVGFLALGLVLDATGICPNVKRIWSPSWVLVSGGICFLFLSLFYFVIDVQGFSAWSFPLRVVGANSIVAYFLSDALGYSGYLHKALTTHLGPKTFEFFGPQYYELTLGFTILAIYWLVLYWMYRKRIFVKI